MVRMISLLLWSCVAAIFGLVTLNAANAAELRVLTSVALTSALDEIVPMVEKATGSKLIIVYDLIAAHRKRILEGETADVIILSRAVMEELQKHDKLAANGLVNLVGTPVSAARQSPISARSTLSSRRS